MPRRNDRLSNAPFQRHHRRYLLRFALAAASTLVALLFAEITLQLIFRSANGYWLLQRSVFRAAMTEPVSDSRRYRLKPLYQDRAAGVRIDPSGFRHTEPSSLSAENVIVFVGDSVPFGYGVRDEETAASVLNSDFRKRNVPWRVINAAVPSFNLSQSFQQLERDVLPQLNRDKPRIVFIQAANDVSLFDHYGDRWTPQTTWMTYRMAHQWRFHAFASSPVAILNYVSRLRKGNETGAFSILPADELQTGAKANPEHLLTNLAKELRLVLERCRRDGWTIVILPINPFYYQTTSQEKNASLTLWAGNGPLARQWKPLIDGTNDVLRRAAQNTDGVYFLDIRRTMDGMNRNDLFIDYLHLSPAGHRVVAKTVEEWLLEQSHTGFGAHPNSV